MTHRRVVVLMSAFGWALFAGLSYVTDLGTIATASGVVCLNLWMAVDMILEEIRGD